MDTIMCSVLQLLYQEKSGSETASDLYPKDSNAWLNSLYALLKCHLGYDCPVFSAQVHCKTTIWLSKIPAWEEALSLPTQQYLCLFKGKIILLD